MKIKLYALSLLATVAMFGCSKFDDTELRNDVNDLKSRVEKLETWCNTANGQISALQSLVTALEQKDFITGVTSIMEGAKEVGYTITFSKGSPITIMHGKDGAQGTAGKDGVTPIIGVKQYTDGFYYWTIKIGDAAETWMTDPTGNKIRTTGDKGANGEDGVPGEDGTPGTDGNDGHSPVLSVDTFEGKLYWKIDGEWLLHSGNKVPAIGDKGDKGDTGANGSNGTNGTDGKDGDSIFAKDGIDLSDPDNVTFTLADGTTKITLPRSSAISIEFDSYDIFYCSATNNQITLVLPATLKETDYNAIVATISNANGTDVDIATRAAAGPDTWSVNVTKPSFDSEGKVIASSAKVTLFAPQSDASSKAILKVTIIDIVGKENSVSRVVEWFDTVIDNTAGALTEKIVNPESVKKLFIKGNVSDADFKFIRERMSALTVLDLSQTTLTAIPERALAFYSSMGLTTNNVLERVVLPKNLATIGNSAFAMCAKLNEVNIPQSVKTLGKWMFEECASLERVNIPEGVSELPESAFYGASGLKSMNIPASVKSIGNFAFAMCANLETITIPATVKSLGTNIFDNCTNLKSATVLADVTELPASIFNNCGALTTCTLNDKIQVIGEQAFGTCSKLSNINIPNSLTTIGVNAFSNTALKTLTLPEGVSYIGESAFYNSTINTLKINSTVDLAIDHRAFFSCSDMTEVMTITLPASLKSISCTSFHGNGILQITCHAVTPPEITTNDPGITPNPTRWIPYTGCYMKVPTGSVGAYKAISFWNNSFPGEKSITAIE